MYHLDGDRLLATHYCPQGNQPRLKLMDDGDPKRLSFAFVDGTGMPGWIDLRLGTVRRTPKTEYTTVASADGWSIFAATPKNALVRLTPTGDWRLTLVRPIERLLPPLRDAVAQACTIIGAMNASSLARDYAIQYRTVTGLAAVFHVVEHFSFHTGQVVTMTKLLTDKDLSLYDAQGRRIEPLNGGSV